MSVKKQAEFDQANAITARIILADPDCYGGEEALAVIWARAFLSARGLLPEPKKVAA